MGRCKDADRGIPGLMYYPPPRNRACTRQLTMARGLDDFLVRVLMAQHFLLSAAARSLSCAKIMRMSDRGVENVFLRLRWPETDGRPVCPHCSCTACYAC